MNLPKVFTMNMIHPRNLDKAKQLFIQNFNNICKYVEDIKCSKYNWSLNFPNKAEEAFQHVITNKVNVKHIGNGLSEMQKIKDGMAFKNEYIETEAYIDFDKLIAECLRVKFTTTMTHKLSDAMITNDIDEQIFVDFGTNSLKLMSNNGTRRSRCIDFIINILFKHTNITVYICFAKYNQQMADEFFPTLRGKINMDLFKKSIIPPDEPIYMVSPCDKVCQICGKNDNNAMMPCYHVSCFDCVAKQQYCSKCNVIFDMASVLIFQYKS